MNMDIFRNRGLTMDIRCKIPEVDGNYINGLDDLKWFLSDRYGYSMASFVDDVITNEVNERVKAAEIKVEESAEAYTDGLMADLRDVWEIAEDLQGILRKDESKAARDKLAAIIKTAKRDI